MVFAYIGSILTTICAVVGAIVLTTYLLPILIYSRFDEQDLRQKYGAKWAIVTGGSSGIGAAIVRKLAAQRINVVVVALDDSILKTSMGQFRAEFPGIQFREVGCDLSEEVGTGQDPEYIKRIKEKTNDIDVQLIFNNAGFIKPGLFAFNSLPSILANYNTNATSATRITHHFSKLLIDKKLPGLITFTSSSAYWVPTVLSAVYGCTKSYLAQLGAVLAAELRPFGVDVVVLHPSPTNSNFYQNVKDVAVLSGAKAISLHPSYPASALFRAAGRVIIVDQGSVNWAFKLACRLIDWNVLVEILAAASKFTGDFSKEMKRIGAKAR
ncbi:NAD(P)-binding protein [Gonapodya prolifera JEL478]|uniref:NAD(P)-binding protein n=1 Tax=Gonapodya prolifera (strain JEL478) TaxID=1344416 RepID=A0A139AX68_GONPJ|nr:NAD(P)-binding protein [Gonapodya prolifera JEL478]|eukprot:KXS21299.1 NAD(P)-binding protein [Gonapodya prolifera JEL478]